MVDTDDLINQMCDSLNNVYLLNNDDHEIDSKLTIIVTTLWSKIFENREIIQNGMNDYNYICIANRLLNIDDVTKLHFINC